MYNLNRDILVTSIYERSNAISTSHQRIQQTLFGKKFNNVEEMFWIFVLERILNQYENIRNHDIFFF